LETIAMTTRSLLDKLRLSDLNPGASSGGVTGGASEWLACSGDRLVSQNPATGEPIAAVTMAEPFLQPRTATVGISGIACRRIDSVGHDPMMRELKVVRAAEIHWPASDTL